MPSVLTPIVYLDRQHFFQNTSYTTYTNKSFHNFLCFFGPLSRTAFGYLAVSEYSSPLVAVSAPITSTATHLKVRPQVCGYFVGLSSGKCYMIYNYDAHLPAHQARRTYLLLLHHILPVKHVIIDCERVSRDFISSGYTGI